MGEPQRIARRRLVGGWRNGRLGVLALTGLLTAAPSHADVVTDGSLRVGAPVGSVQPGYENGNYANYLIKPELGELRGVNQLGGANLFHSFSEFDVRSGEVATFTGPDQTNVARVISRVTGVSQASIAGTLRSTIDGAAVYLLSPSGIAVKDGAVFDVPGSIYLSTADALRFDDGESFYVDTGDARTLLSVAGPSAFGFTSGAPASVVVGRSQIGAYRVPEGRILSFVGGDVAVNAANAKTIDSPGSTVQIASAASVIDIPIDPIEFRNFDPSSLEAGRLGTVAISGADIAVNGTPESAGSIVIRGEIFRLNGGADLTSFDPSSNDSNGAIDIRVRGWLDLRDGRMDTRTTSAADGVGIYLAGDEVTLADTDVWSFSLGAGKAGDIEIAAQSSIEIDSAAWVRSSASKSGAGSEIHLSVSGGSTAGNIAISGPTTKVTSDTTMNGLGGSIRIDAAEVEVVDAASIVSETKGDAEGGAIVIEAGNLSITSGGQVLSRASASSARGEDAMPGGTISLGSAERPIASVEIADGGLVSSTASKLAGGAVEVHAGNLTIRDGQIQSIATAAGSGGVIMLGSEDDPIAEIEILDGGTVASGNQGSETGGDIIAHADHLWVHNTEPGNETFVFSETKFDNGGAGGSIEIHASEVDLENGGQIFTIAEGTGKGGALSLIGVDTLRISGEEPKPEGDESARLKASLAAGVGTDGKATGGGLSIEARVVEVLDGGEIASRTFGKGDAAPEGVNAIDITASERITVQGGENGASQISATTDSKAGQEEKAGGSAGDIAIRTALFELVDGGQVTASTTTSGEAGNVTIMADKVALSGIDPTFGNPSGIFAQSITRLSGSPGSIRISANDSVKLTDALIFAQSAGPEDAGDIEIDAGELFESTNSLLATSAEQAAGGDIRVAANDLVYLFDSDFTTDVFGGAGGGGNVLIDPEFTVLNRSQITARAVTGDGGNITINTDFYFESGGSGLDASSDFGNDGTIQTTVPDTDLSGTLAALPSSFLDASALLARGCGAQTARAGSFVVESMGIIEPPPDAILRATDADLSGAVEACSP